MPDTSVKIFDSTMTGAPTMPSTAGAIIAVLDACLKDGFGLKSVDSIVVASGIATVNISTGHSAKQDVVMLIAGSGTSALNGEKRTLNTTATAFTFDATGVADGTYTGSITAKVAPAGWTKPFSSGATLAAYKSSNVQATGHYFRFDDTATGTYEARFFGCETMSDINTYPSKFPNDSQQPGGLFMTRRSQAAGNSPWWIIADDRTVFIGIAINPGGPVEYQISAFGDFVSRKANDPFNSFVHGCFTALSGAYPTPTTMTIFTSQSFSGGGTYCARSYTGFGGSIALPSKYNAQNTGTASGLHTSPFPNPVDNSMIFDSISLQESAAFNASRGKMPGVLACLQGVYGQITDGAVLPAMPNYPSRKFLWKNIGSSGQGTRGGFAIDITGPWER